MTENILDIRRLAEMPKTVGGQQLFIFVPLANAYEPGIASFSSQDFTVTGRSAMVTINTNKFVTLTKLAEELAKKVDKTTKINNKSLDKDIVIYASDVPMAANNSTSVLAKFGLVDAKIAKLEQDTSAVYRYRGSVNTYADLLSIWDSKTGTGSQKPRVGDTYDVKSLNMNYAFVDEVSATAPNGWDALGQLFVLTPATPNKIGGVKPDDMTIGVKEDGTIYAKPATNDKPGIVQPDGETMFIKNGKLSTNPNTDDRAYIQSLFDLYFKSVDYVFAGINPELELLENPVQVVLGSDGMGYVNLDYPLDLVEGKNYHIKATIGKLDGSVEEYEKDITAKRNDIDQPMCLLDYSDQKIIYVIDKVKFTSPGVTEADENASAVSAGDDGDTKVWSYVTFTSIVQKEAGPTPGVNLLKEPIVVTKEEAAQDGVEKFMGYTLGFEIGKPYAVGINIGGVEYSITAITMDGGSMEEYESLGSFPILTSDSLRSTSGRIAVIVYDGVEFSGEALSKADNAYVMIMTKGVTTSFEVNSIKEVDVVDDWEVPLVATIENPQKEVVYKYYNKTSSLFAANQNVKITGSIVIDGTSHTFDETVQTEQITQNLYKIDVSIIEIDQSFSIGDGLLLDDNGAEANYVTLLIDNTYPDGSPMSELRIDSITIT